MDINVERYIINHTAFGYSQLNVTDTNSIANITDSVVVVVVDKTTTNQLYKYYTAIETFEKNNNRVMVIGTKEVNDELNEDAVVLGGSGENARRCISAASCNIKMEILPEVRELCDWLIKKDETVPETSPGQNTAAPSDGAASD